MVFLPATSDRRHDGSLDDTTFQVFGAQHLRRIPQLERLGADQRLSMRAVAAVLPFRVNRYVIDHLIDWDSVPDDPMFQLTFPQPRMLRGEDFRKVRDMVASEAPRDELQAVVARIRMGLNPHPAGQQDLNVPTLDGRRLDGMQHKYPETLLFFPSHGQTCHSYCTFCFRWAQFVGDKELRFSANQTADLHEYLRRHGEVTDLLVTGGDPMVMKAHHLRDYLEPLLRPEFDHVQSIRIGTKSLTFWPHRFVSDADADDVLRLFEELVDAGKHVALMAHYNHARELGTDAARAAIRRVRDTGVTIRSQGPLLANVNDDADVWADLWREQVRAGVVPYYMFVERDTGARRYFEVPLVRAWEIYRGAMQQVSGLGRTARGPSMSAAPGKVEVQGVAEVQGEEVFVLRFVQARNAAWVQRPFFARFDDRATWLDDLEPAFGEERFFFEDAFAAMCARPRRDGGSVAASAVPGREARG